MTDVVELRNAANTLRQWAKEIRHENVPALYATTDQDIGILGRVADLLEQAADEILRLRTPLPK
jgi:hypothetical protein